MKVLFWTLTVGVALLPPTVEIRLIRGDSMDSLIGWLAPPRESSLPTTSSLRSLDDTKKYLYLLSLIGTKLTHIPKILAQFLNSKFKLKLTLIINRVDFTIKLINPLN